MKFNQLPAVPQYDNLSILIERLKSELIARATGKEHDNAEYQRIRKLILTNAKLEKLAPAFLKSYATLDSFWEWIKEKASKYEERKVIIKEGLHPLIDVLEFENGPSALEFGKSYQEIDIIGDGGFGVVYKFEHKLLKMPFAVKVFSPSFYEGGTDQKEQERFFQESRMLFDMHHPNIIRVYDAGLMGNRPFIRMEFFPGLNLYKFIEQHGLFTEADALTAMKHITSAIKHAHDRGILHRDLKPSNIMATRPNDFRVIDFGLGIYIENELHSRLTTVGTQTIGGLYNAPELVADPRLIDKRSDIYSLGALWYTMLSGLPPAGSGFINTLGVMGISDKTIAAIAKCMTPLESRYPDCKDLLDDLQAL
ncbi:serine/threonine protein kinase [Mucilaginibacter sp. SMC90]|uniref:serine/threonine protein kinase n=1 Tax=Mucilaginibacter sp. SMC90 TaxID=2929803 RepID=UPI001FB34B08|nr:serine/threonine-protein kinase [Mucilaginibacter sp. SMC90]UOE52465.1 serine/threonine protein kinase [Mucilaginibacter sp. SMC90]